MFEHAIRRTKSDSLNKELFIAKGCGFCPMVVNGLRDEINTKKTKLIALNYTPDELSREYHIDINNADIECLDIHTQKDKDKVIEYNVDKHVTGFPSLFKGNKECFLYRNGDEIDYRCEE